MPPARQYRGAFTALVTPFTATGAIDQDAFRSLVRRQIDSGIHGLVACGTTGETPTLSHEEDEWVIATTLEVASERPSR
ncbi:MAG TPA: dihydrodipicolinate synthase family protein, partial [Terriglobales bacterium]|nr:dihydrodipicolinate synthase family protein [Terriglobales bacterium]